MPVQVVLHVARDHHERVVSGQTDSGQVRELTLRVRFRFRLSTVAGKVLIDDLYLGVFTEGEVVPPPIPEPETYAMMLAGLGLMASVARRRKTKQA